MATLMVLLIFNLKGAGYSIILPRLIDTLLGCFLLLGLLLILFGQTGTSVIFQTILRKVAKQLSITSM